jgi:hypothetical protein
MHRFLGLILCGLTLTLAFPSSAAPARILKVLTHLVDQQGRHTLSPSLFERDAYQSRLRKSPESVSGLRFDIQWKRGESRVRPLRMRVETRGAKAGAKPIVVEREVDFRGLFTAWAKLPLSREQYLALGGVSAWRATLWDGEQMLDEVKSFLW